MESRSGTPSGGGAAAAAAASSATTTLPRGPLTTRLIDDALHAHSRASLVPPRATVIVGAVSSSSSSGEVEEEELESCLISERPLPLPPPPHPPLHWPHVVSAIGAGAITAVCTSPFDVIRTRLAVQEHATVYNGLIGSFRTTWREEGLRGLYRGFGPTIVVIPLFWAIYFTSYASCKDHLSSSQTEWVRELPMWGRHLLAACSAGAVADVLVNPLFVARTRMQTQHMRILAPASNPSGVVRPTLYTGTINTLTRLWREEGGMSLMRGVSASLFGLMHVMIQFPIYEHLRVTLPTATKAYDRAAEEGQDRWTAAIAELTSTDPSHTTTSSSADAHKTTASDPRPWHLIVASAVSKLIASVVSYPHETMRARLQNAPVSVYAGLRDCFTKTVEKEGFGALYKGLGGQHGGGRKKGVWR